ncbi:VOC family protein [Paracoccus onubensis]|uniref:VOC family protein n=1 Tax=Paracoccus onubensis TaxID=1675788 RepID=UPI0027304397|nr:VOC family protein [Paracoccus onubensis]MDP0927724.1 VOC family protein [Paracoccus onubensis]
MKALPQLMFQRDLGEVVALWTQAFPDMTVTELAAKGEPRRVSVNPAGQELILFHSPVSHQFDFTPSISIVVSCERADEVDHLAGVLGDGGKTFMPLDSYPFSPRFTWIADRFGVSWQLMQQPEGQG